MIRIQDVFHSDKNILAYRISRTECFPIEILPLDAVSEAANVHAYSLSRPVGGYINIDGLGCVPANEPGLYRIYRLSDAACVQWIIRDADIVTFAASVATMFYHAANEPPELRMNSLDAMPDLHAYVLSSAPSGKVGAICLTAANSFAMFCHEAGLESVLWEFQDVETAYTPAKTHALTEVLDPSTKKRMVIDIDRKLILKDEYGEPLNCVDYVNAARNGDALKIEPISNARIAGFGATARMPKVLDFAVELFELADDGYRQEIFRNIGKSMLIRGTRYFGEKAVITLPGLPARIRQFLSSPAAEALTDQERLYLGSVMQYPEAAF